MITQQAKDHAQACYDATKEAAIHSHMGDAQKAAYMTILAKYRPVETRVRPNVPRPSPPITDCLCENCAPSARQLVDGYKPCAGYTPPMPTSDIKPLMFGVLAFGILFAAVAAYPTIRAVLSGWDMLPL